MWIYSGCDAYNTESIGRLSVVYDGTQYHVRVGEVSSVYATPSVVKAAVVFYGLMHKMTYNNSVVLLSEHAVMNDISDVVVMPELYRYAVGMDADKEAFERWCEEVQTNVDRYGDLSAKVEAVLEHMQGVSADSSCQTADFTQADALNYCKANMPSKPVHVTVCGVGAVFQPWCKEYADHISLQYIAELPAVMVHKQVIERCSFLSADNSGRVLVDESDPVYMEFGAKMLDALGMPQIADSDMNLSYQLTAGAVNESGKCPLWFKASFTYALLTKNTNHSVKELTVTAVSKFKKVAADIEKYRDYLTTVERYKNEVFQNMLLHSRDYLMPDEVDTYCNAYFKQGYHDVTLGGYAVKLHVSQNPTKDILTIEFMTDAQTLTAMNDALFEKYQVLMQNPADCPLAQECLEELAETIGLKLAPDFWDVQLGHAYATISTECSGSDLMQKAGWVAHIEHNGVISHDSLMAVLHEFDDLIFAYRGYHNRG